MRVVTESLLFRALILATLVTTAALFAIRHPVISEGAEAQQQLHVDQDSQHEKADKTIFGVGAEGWTAVFTGVLAVFTIGLAVVTYRLFQVTRSGILEQAQLTRTSLEVAARSAAAAERAVDVTSRSSQQQLRAYIAADDVRMTLAPDGKAVFFCNFRNCGQTPAYSITTSGGCFLGKYPLENARPLGDPTGEIQSSGTLGPGMHIHIVSELDGVVTKQQAADIMAGKAALFFFGRVIYRDIFKEDRYTEFCYMRVMNIASGPMNIYRGFNEAN